MSFTTLKATQDLHSAIQTAITNMIEEIKKPVDAELSGAARKAELQSIKMTAVDCRELLSERLRLEEMIKSLSDTGEVKKEIDFSGGFAEKNAKK